MIIIIITIIIIVIIKIYTPPAVLALFPIKVQFSI